MSMRPRSSRRLGATATVTVTVTGVALAVLAAGLAAAPAALAAPSGPAPHGSRAAPQGHGPDALRRLLATLPDGVTDAALVRVSGPGARLPYTGTAGPVEADAVFPVGSVTKVFTDAVVLQLVAEHRIGIDEPVRPRFPDLIPAGYAGVTVRQLLDHTSDLPRPKPEPLAPRGLLAASFAEDAAKNPGRVPVPGTVQQYNGLNSFLAGLLVEQVTGRPYAEELDRRILRPLGLRHTGLSEDPSIAWAGAEGGLESNAADLDTFLRALTEGRLLPPAQQRHLFEVPEVPSAPGNTSCPPPTACFSAGGLMGIELNGTRVWGKTGSSGGWSSGIFMDPARHRRTVYTLRPDAGAHGNDQRTRVEAVVTAALIG
ncbi:serine hydrolase domain-containing protein [Streptomyces sp. NBC_00454]|uniref:serine hydrolase domain-containing protein n=1 Tax=Streptomyces sp. NBC_00454 TaxID=2975747 RepID=UPI0030E1B935